MVKTNKLQAWMGQDDQGLHILRYVSRVTNGFPHLFSSNGQNHSRPSAREIFTFAPYYMKIVLSKAMQSIHNKRPTVGIRKILLVHVNVCPHELRSLRPT